MFISVYLPKIQKSIESPYHDVSGLPDPYMEQMSMGEDQLDHPKPPQQHMQLGGYDENLESGYSTPNSRNRRVIREIIV
jgi:echinoid protein